MIARVITLCMVMLVSVVVGYGQMQLLKDVNTAPSSGYIPFNDLKTGTTQFFFVKGSSLFVSKGSAATTVEVSKYKRISDLTIFNNVAYYAADDGNGAGIELWKSNGLTTIRLSNINPIGDSDPRDITVISPTLIYFTAYSPAYGRELWKTTGSESGTKLVKDILKIKGSSNPAQLTKSGSLLFFTANDGQRGIELWKSDGTDAGTTIVKDIQPEPKWSSTPKHLTDVNGTLFFGATQSGSDFEVWKTDGTEAGTVMVKDIRPGNGNSEAEHFVNVNGTLFFTANDGVHGDELWKSDGTQAGTMMVKDFNPGYAGSNSSNMWSYPMSAFTNVNGVLYYWGSKGYKNYYIRSDGTEAGTFAIVDAHTVGLNPPQPNFTYFNGKVYFFNYSGSGYGMYSVDISGQNVNFIRPYTTPEDSYENFEQKMILMGSNFYLTSFNVESWSLVKQTPTGTITTLYTTITPTVNSWPDRFTQVGDQMYFLTYNEWPGSGEYLYKTDGTPEGTVEVFEADYNSRVKAIGNKFFFTVLQRLYVIDGANGTPQLLTEFTDWTHAANGLTNVNGILYFHNSYGEVWKSDGTVAGTVKVRALNKIINITNVADKAYILNETSTGGLELWRTNATGLLKVKTIREGTGRPAAFPQSAGVGSVFYFTADDGVHGNELWRSDGTALGTFMIKDMNTYDSTQWGAYEADIKSFVVFNNKLYFSAANENNDWRYYYVSGKTTISEVGVVGPVNYSMHHNGKLYLFAQASASNYDMTLWVTDGTPGSLRVHADIESHNKVDYAVVNNVLYFNFESDRLFQVTDCGIVPVDDGTIYSYGIEAFGDHLMLAAGGNNVGIEPHIYYNIASTAETCTMESARVATTAEESVFTPYPNPYTATFTMRIEGTEGEQADVQVFTGSGFPVENFSGITTNTDYENIGSTWPKGTYIVKVQKGKTVTSHRVVKK